MVLLEFFIGIILPHYGPEIDSASERISTRNIFLLGKGGRCVELTTLSPCADCLEIWKDQPPGSLRDGSGLYGDCFNFTYKRKSININTATYKMAKTLPLFSRNHWHDFAGR